MDKVLEIGGWILANYQLVITSLIAICSAIMVVALKIPGDQPEKFLQSAVDFLSKFSSKPSDPQK
jgi:hypothetical protein